MKTSGTPRAGPLLLLARQAIITFVALLVFVAVGKATGRHAQVMRGVVSPDAGKRVIGLDATGDSDAVVKVSFTNSGGP